MLFKNARWRKFVVPLLLVMGINFSYVPVTQAGTCSWWDLATLGLSCGVKVVADMVGESTGKGLARGVKPEFDKMVDEAGKQLADHVTNSVNWNKIGKELGQGASDVVLKALQSINWKKYGQEIGAGLRKEFEATMDKLFAEKIRPLLREVDMVLANRLEQADKIAENRLKQLDGIIEARLKQVDALIQSTFDQFRVTVNDTITKVRTDLIDYTFSQASEWRDDTIQKVRTDVVDYITTAFKKTTDETVAKIRKDLLDHSFAELEKLRQAFSGDVVYFFKEAKELIVRLECAEEKTRIDVNMAISQLNQLGKEYIQEIKNFKPTLEIKNFKPTLSFGKSKTPSTPSTPSIPDNVKYCYEKAGIDINNIESIQGFEYLTIYEIKKCKALSTLDQDTPIKRISNVYWDLYMFAQRVACFQDNPEHFVWDLLKLKYEYEYWNAMRYY
jgi:hypothetical protein